MDMDQESREIAFYMLLLTTGVYVLEEEEREIKRKRKRRQFKIRPLNQIKQKQGHYNNLIKRMRLCDENQFFKYNRMSVIMFDQLLEIMEPYLQKTLSKNPLSPGERLTITLHYLSEGCSMQELAWNYYIGITTVHCVLKETCELLWNVLSIKYVKPPNSLEFKNIAEAYYKRWNMPNCIGALDGKHIQIQSPARSGSEFFNYKKSFSLVLMATCDSYYRFTLVDIGGAGSNHDSEIFRNSKFGMAILHSKNEILELPGGKALPGTEDILPYFFVADQAFPLHQRIMRPFPGEHLEQRKKIFNYRVSRARRCIENTFGIFAQRWRLFRKPIIAKIENCERFVKAAVVLHNYLQTSEMDIHPLKRKYCPTGFADYVDIEGNFHYGQWRDEQSLQSIGRVGANFSSRIVREYREKLADWFISDYGSVPWQEERVNRGILPDK